jgi:DNA-binding NarL/FixJ family response regulator
MWYATTRAKLASAVAMVLYSRRSSRVGARRIRKLCPESKIVFLSQESSGDVIEEALNSGGTGYVVKTNAASELLDAIDGIRTGGQVVGTACR